MAPESCSHRNSPAAVADDKVDDGSIKDEDLDAWQDKFAKQPARQVLSTLLRLVLLCQTGQRVA